MAEHARPKDRVARYSGTVLNAAEAANIRSAYKFQVHNDLVLDAQNEGEFSGRYVNDGPRAGRPANTRFGSRRRTTTCPETGKQWISIFATKPLKPDDEILVDYGRDYDWDTPHATMQHAVIPIRNQTCMTVTANRENTTSEQSQIWRTLATGLRALATWLLTRS